MRTSIIAAVLVALLALLGSVESARAGSTSGSISVSPGSRVCSTVVYGASKVRADGQATAPGVRWTLNRSADGVNFTQISQSGSDFTTAYAAQFNATFTPVYFPGSFKLCARNASTSGVSVNLLLRTDADVP